MSTRPVCLAPESGVSEFGMRSIDENLRTRLQTLFQTLSPSSDYVERRHSERFPYPRLITLFPTDSKGVATAGKPVVVVGKHISFSGLGFFHSALLPHRRMVAVFDVPGHGRMALLTDLMWCRFAGEGWYENGGRFLRFVDLENFPENTTHLENVT